MISACLPCAVTSGALKIQGKKFMLTQTPFLPDLVPFENEGQDAHRLAFIDEGHIDNVGGSPIRMEQDSLVGFFSAKALLTAL